MIQLVAGEEEVGAQKRCTRCGDWWPAEPEFYFEVARAHGRKALHAWCKACNYDLRNVTRKKSGK